MIISQITKRQRDIFSQGYSLLYIFALRSSSVRSPAVFQLSRATLSISPSIRGYFPSPAMLLNSISRFFSALSLSVLYSRKGNEWETGIVVFGGDVDFVVVSLSFIRERRSPPRVEDCNFEATLSSRFLGCHSLSFSQHRLSASYHVYHASRFWHVCAKVIPNR